MYLFTHGVTSCPIVPCAHAFLVHVEVLGIVDVAIGSSLYAIQDL